MNEFLHRGIESNNLGGYKFSNITEMNLKTLSNKRNLTYEYYIKNPMLMVERRLNMIISRKPRLINALDRSVKHLLIRK